MKNVLIVAPILSGKGGTETVLKRVLCEYIEDKNINMKLLILGGTKSSAWLKDIPEDRVIICNIKSKVLRLIWYFFFMIFNHFESMVIINTQLIHVTRYIINLMGRKNKTKIISWIHFSLRHSGTVKTKYLKDADLNLAISSGIASQMMDEGIDSGLIKTIYNPVRINKAVSLNESEGLRLVYVGRIEYNHQKNFEQLLTGLSKVKLTNWILDVYGTGEEEEECKQLADKLNISQNIVWHGWVEDPWQMIDKINALVLSSNYEGFPMVLLEALSRGIPCIANDCPTGPNDLVKDDINGKLVKVNNSDDMANSIEWLFKNRNSLKQKDIQESIYNFYDGQYFSRLTKLL